MGGSIAGVAEILARKHTYTPPPDFGPDVSADHSVGTGAPIVLLFVGGLFLIVLFVYLTNASKKRRRTAFVQMAGQLNLSYSEQDPFGLLGYPFELLHKGDGRGVENVLHGAWQEVDVVAFDYWYYDESTDSNGSTSRTYRRFDCALVPMPADCPRLTIDRESLFTRLADALSFHDIQFESEAFNREFTVRCEVPKFANDLIDARMMQWLQASGSGHAYEAIGNRLLVAGPKIDPQAFTELLGVARGFVQHVPKVVPSLYPG
ncbi:MAG: hypothetical protein ABJB55_05155 [Actinomycetota bacterium]